MAKSYRQFIRSDLVEYRGTSRPPETYPFPEDAVVSKSIPLRMKSCGAYLRIPINTCAVLNLLDTSTEVIEKGGMIYRETGNYTVRYVDLREFSRRLEPIGAESSDGWFVKLVVELTWKIFRPLEIAKMDQPLKRLDDLCKAAVVHFIQTHRFDEVVPLQGGSSLPETTVASAILKLLRENPALTAFQFISLNLLERVGDRRRTEKLQAGLLKQTETEQSLKNQITQLTLELDVTRQKLQLALENEKVMVQVAHAERMQDEEKLRIEATKARQTADIWETLRQATQQMIELRQLSASQQLDQQRIIRMMELSSDAFRDFAQVIAQAQLTPGLQQSLENSKAFEYLQNAFAALARISAEDGGKKGADRIGADKFGTGDNEPRVHPIIDLNDSGG